MYTAMIQLAWTYSVFINKGQSGQGQGHVILPVIFKTKREAEKAAKFVKTLEVCESVEVVKAEGLTKEEKEYVYETFAERALAARIAGITDPKPFIKSNWKAQA